MKGNYAGKSHAHKDKKKEQKKRGNPYDLTKRQPLVDEDWLPPRSPNSSPYDASGKPKGG